MATASEKGTVIRLHSIIDGKLLQEVRRGTEFANIFSISFDQYGQWMASSSDQGTIHVFSVKLSEQEKSELKL